MKTLNFLVALCLFATCSVWGQVTVNLKLDQTLYLSGEQVIADVEVINFSGQTLRLGEAPNWVEFSVESIDSSYVTRHKEMDLSGEFDLGASMTARKSVDIQPYYDIIKSGRYRVTAIVNLPEWGQTFGSTAQTFDVVNGVEQCGFDVGIPDKTKKNTHEGGLVVPEMRHYALIKVAYQDKLRLYARITNQAKDAVYKVVMVCGMVAFSDPKGMVDSKSCLHIINQMHAKRFIYFVMDTDGNMLKREFYDYVGSKPVLSQNPDGSVNVRGGLRMWTTKDFPPSPRPTMPESIVTRPGDSVTNAPPDIKNMTKEEKKRYQEEQKRLKEEKRRLEKEEKKRKKDESGI